MEWVEVTGKNVDEAKEAALDQLGVAEGDAELVVVTEPKTGLFGRVRGEARVRARVRPVGPRPKRQRRPSGDRARSSGGGNGKGSGGGDRRGGQPKGTADGSGRSRQGGGRGPAEKTEKTADLSGGGSASREGEGGGQSRSARRRRSRSGSRPAGESSGGSGAGGKSAAQEGGRQGRRNGPPEGPRAKEEIEMAEGMTLEEQAEVAKEFLQGLLDQFGFEAALDTRILDEETVELAATGEGLGLLVGPKGSTLAALQDVTRTVVQRQFPSRTDRILVDVAGYRERRAAALQRFTEQVATEVIESGAERALEPMSPADRKVVHDAVNEIDGVVTRSEGEDLSRHVVIAPAG